MYGSIQSPDGRLELCFFEEQGELRYSVKKDGREACAPSPAGLLTKENDLFRNLVFMGSEFGTIDESYLLPAYKKDRIVNRCSTMRLLFGAAGMRTDCADLVVEARAYNEGAAFRLTVPGGAKDAEKTEDTAGRICTIQTETTGFRLPAGAETVYAMKWLACYEDNYHPVPMEDLHQNRYVFPVLIPLGGRQFAVYAEAAVCGSYGGSQLSAVRGDTLLSVTKAADQTDPISGPYPFSTPWRVVMAGSLSELVESDILENLNPAPIVKDTSFIQPGACAWSWMSEHSSPRSPERMRDYVDFAAEMGWPYSMVDGGWPGYIDVPSLVEYAAEKGVKIWVWEHSNKMRTPGEAEEKMALWKSWGVAGVKIDFFESDAQARMSQYEMLAKLAAKHRLMLNFHGCTKPSGTIRVWPHVLSYEGVEGEEYLAGFSTFNPQGPDAAHNCTLPFTRNLMGPMDYTPVTYESYRTGTTDAHQTALPIIFTSYIFHCGEKKEAVEKHPFRPFLEKLPTSWDETRLLEGYPANYVTMARRKKDVWYVAGICARRPRNAEITFDFLKGPAGEPYEAVLYADDLSDLVEPDAAVGALPPMDAETIERYDRMPSKPCYHQHNVHLNRVENFDVRPGETVTVPMSVNGGFALVVRPKSDANG